jgi:hypothetical protein
MALVLGPMPSNVRNEIRRLIGAGGGDAPQADERLNGLLLAGCPGGASYLDADGEVWNWFMGIGGFRCHRRYFAQRAMEWVG